MSGMRFSRLVSIFPTTVQHFSAETVSTNGSKVQETAAAHLTHETPVTDSGGLARLAI